MKRSRSLFRSPLIRRVQRHTTVATMFHGPSPVIQRAQGEFSAFTILPTQTADQQISNQQSEINNPSITPSPNPQTPISNLQSPVTSSQSPAKSSWSLPKIFRKWQENRVAKAGTTQTQPPSTIQRSSQTPAPSSSVVLSQARPVTLEQPPISSPRHTADVPVPQPIKATPSPIQHQPVGSPVSQPLTPPVVATPNPPALIQVQPLAQPSSQTAPQTDPLPASPSPVDPAWKRLETIMRMHEEKRVHEEGPNQPASSHIIIPSHTGATPLTPIAPASNVIQAQPIPTPSASETPVSSPPTLPDTPDSNWKRLQTIMRKHEEKQASEATSQPPTSEPATPPNVEPTARPTPSTPTPTAHIQRQSTPRSPSTYSPPPTPPNPENHPSRSESHLPDAEFDADQTQLFITSPEYEESEPLQPFSLENVWPVQRVEQKPASTSQKPSSISAEYPISNIQAPPLQPEQEAVLRKVSETAKTGQPTDSHVELILPRSPRPTSIQKSSPAPTPEATSTSTSKSSEYFKPNHPASSQAPFQETPSIENTLSDKPINIPTTSKLEETPTAITPPTSSQTEINDSRSSILDSRFPPPPFIQREAAETMIPTEIGPLPSDLWQLLGQTPPGTEPPVSTPLTPSASQSHQTTLQPSSSVPSSSTVSPTTPTESPTHIDQAVSSYPAPTSSPKISSSLPSEQQTINPAPSSPPIQRTPQGQSLETVIQQSNRQQPSSSLFQSPPNFPHPVLQRAEASPQPTAPSASTPPGNQEGITLSEQELDKIARQVYAELRQKLSIERERSRGWMR